LDAQIADVSQTLDDEPHELLAVYESVVVKGCARRIDAGDRLGMLEQTVGQRRRAVLDWWEETVAICMGVAL
jgi:nitroimidazol reductase NimA-like FMN-containing flavoprotein (pyridoxamine 5'-phosphate oxidase superfamily)